MEGQFRICKKELMKSMKPRTGKSMENLFHIGQMALITRLSTRMDNGMEEEQNTTKMVELLNKQYGRRIKYSRR